jgi:uncharacterized protein (TIGR03437 family)
MFNTNCILTTWLCASMLTLSASAQNPTAILRVDIENWVAYGYDVTDPSALAKTAGPVLSTAPANFGNFVHFADITAVNGSSAKGTLVLRTQVIQLTPAPNSGQAVGDVVRGQHAEFSFEFLQPDGSQIGSIFAAGLSGGIPAPGSPSGATAGNNTIVGGTGIFVGARGTVNQGQVTSRVASQTEDPSMRRSNGGGKGQFLLQIVPMVRPEIMVSPMGWPGVFHADWTPVDSMSPARPGETLIVYTSGLGPTRPVMGPEEVFPSDPLAVVTSPVDVIVDGAPSRATIAEGVPGTTGTYRLQFHVPDSTASGMAPVRIRAAWIDGTLIQIPVQ